MSWSAYACGLEPDHWGPGKEDLVPIFLPHEALPAFAAAAQHLRDTGQGVDSQLEVGRLSFRAAARALDRATGVAPYGGDWSPEQVKNLAATADWSFSVPQDERGDKASAQAFLRLCAANGLGMHFD